MRNAVPGWRRRPACSSSLVWSTALMPRRLARGWRGRSLRGSGLTAGADEDLASRARALLDARLVAVAERPGLPRMPVELESPLPADPRHKQAVARFEEMVEACARCGALSAEELSRWRSRLREVDDGRSWHLERERRQQRFTAADLRMVLAGPADVAGLIRVTSAERYAGGVVLRWHETGGSSEAPRTSADLAAQNRPGRRRVASVNDLGTEYLHFHTGEMHTGEAVLWSAQFATAVPDRARELAAEIRDQRFRLPLARGAGGDERAAHDRAVATLERQLAGVHPGEPESMLEYRRGLTAALVEARRAPQSRTNASREARSRAPPNGSGPLIPRCMRARSNCSSEN